MFQSYHIWSSYNNRPYRGMNRRTFLSVLRSEKMTRDKIEKVFLKIISPILPSKPRAAASGSGYTETYLKIEPNKKQKLRFRQLIYELKRDGLITPDKIAKTESEMAYRITTAGLRWLENFKKHFHPELPNYPTVASPQSAVTIVSYDVPEKSKYLREWLRRTLQNFGLKPIQRSVFIGKIKLPEQFIKDIVIFNLEKCVEIFEITKTGTLKHRI